MKSRKWRVVLAFLCMVILSTTMLACNNGSGGTVVDEYKYDINATSKSLMVNDEFQLQVKSTPAKELKVTYATKNDKVVTVTSSGLLRAVAVGSADVTATVDGVSLKCAVTVTNYTITFTESAVDISFGSKANLEYSVLPETTIKPTYTSSVTTVAVVEGDKIKAVGLGSSVITATLNGSSATCVVNVKPLYSSVSEVNIKTGETHQISVVCEPTTYIPTLTYASKNATVATVSEAGLISALAVGDAVIEVFDAQVLVKSVSVKVAQTYTYSLNHSSYELLIGDSVDLNVIVTPTKELAPGSVVFSSDNTAVATVDTNGMGIVTAVSKGSANITARVEGTDIICAITVTEPSAAKATASKVEAKDGDKYNLSQEYDGLRIKDWMYFGAESNHDERMQTTTPLITAKVDATNVDRIAFWDYKTEMSFTNGTTNATRMGITSGVATAKVNNVCRYELTVKLTENSKLIRVFTGAYQATNVTEMTFGNYRIASEKFKADGVGVGYYIDFELDLTLLDWSAGHEDYSVKIAVSPSAGNENVTIVAVQTFDAEAGFVPTKYEGAMPSSKVSFETAPTAYNLSTVNGYTVQDWAHMGSSDTDSDGKNTANKLISVKLPTINDTFPDYKTKLSYTDGKRIASASDLTTGRC